MVIAPQGDYVFENSIDFIIIEICFIYQMRREPQLCLRQGQPAHRFCLCIFSAKGPIQRPHIQLREGHMSCMLTLLV